MFNFSGIKRNTVVVNLKRVTSDQAKRIMDFLSGTIYAIKGNIQKIGSGIFLCTPNNINVQGKITDDTEKDKDKDNDDEVKDYLQKEQPEDIEKLRLYYDKLLPLHKLYSIEKRLEDALKEYVWMKSGSYLVIQPTEALTVIDVNTGKNISKKKDDETYLKINLEAAREAAKQIRLRNLSGIIIVDFINMNKKEYTEQLLSEFESLLKRDPIATTLVDMTKLQLVEVTRKKVRKPLHELMYAK